jgi:hypothetical protein
MMWGRSGRSSEKCRRSVEIIVGKVSIYVGN